MFPYFALLFTIAIMTLFDGKKFDKVIFFILVIWMFIFSAFRVGGIGEGDYDAYQRFYLVTDTFDKVLETDLHVEIGFRFLSFLGHLGGFDEQYIIIAMAILALIPVVYVIYRYSPYKILSLLIWMPYFLTMNMHSSRTSVAAAFGLWFIIFFYENKKVLALLTILVAISFHSAALVLILVFLTKIAFKKLFIIVTGIFPTLLFISPFEIVIKLFNSIGLSKVSSAISLYIISEDYGYPMVIYDPRILLNVGIVILIFLYRQEIFRILDEYYFKIYMIGTLLMIILSDVVIMSWRLSYYFLLLGVVVIPWLAKVINIIIQNRYNNRRVMSCIIALSYCLYATPIIVKALPYKFIIESLL